MKKLVLLAVLLLALPAHAQSVLDQAMQTSTSGPTPRAFLSAAGMTVGWPGTFNPQVGSSRVQLQATQTSSPTNPTLVLGDVTAAAGVPVYGGFNQAGGGYTVYGRADEGTPAFFNFVDLGTVNQGTLLNGSGSMDVGIWSLEPAPGQMQGMLSFFNAQGNCWNCALSAVQQGDQLGEIAAFGYATNGMIETESASIWFYAAENFSNTGSVPTETNTKAGTNIVFRNVARGTDQERVTAVIDTDGNFDLGDWGTNPAAAFPCKRCLVIQQAAGTPTGYTTGGYMLYVDPADNKLKARGPSGTITVLATP